MCPEQVHDRLVQRLQAAPATRLKRHMKNSLMSLHDKLMLRKRSLIKTVNKELKNVCQIKHPPENKKSRFHSEIRIFTVFCFSSKWCHQESNRGHKDFQSFALPTELWHPACLRVQRYDNILDCASNLELFFSFSCFFPDASILVP